MLLASTLLVVLAWWLQGERRNRMLGEV
jgi:hypothetical protein